MGFLKYLLISFGVGAVCFFTACSPYSDSTATPAAVTFSQASLMSGGISENPSTTLSSTTDFDFGQVNLGASQDAVFTVVNSGDLNVTGLSGMALTAPFVYKQGYYPGNGGTCTSVLTEHSSCTVVVTFSPTLNGVANTTLALQWSDGTNQHVTEQTIFGTGGVVSPMITSISPSFGDATGSTAVTITGSQFVSGATVTVGGAPCLSPTLVSFTTLTCTATSHVAGTVDVVVTNPGSLTGMLSDGFTYYAAPTISSLSPAAGAQHGGTLVTISGTGLRSGATVLMGSTACGSVTVVSSTTLTCTTGASASGGTVNVTVTNTDLQTVIDTNAYTYDIAPTLTSVTPSYGPVDRETTITLTGTTFLPGATVKVGTVTCLNPVVNSSTSMSCTTGLAMAAGTDDVVVTNPDGQSAALANGFTYSNPPTVTSISPNVGPVTGNTTVTITGTGFNANALVSIGSSPCLVLDIISTTTLTCATTSTIAPGVVNVTVTNSDTQSGTLSNGFTYLGPPVLSLISPTSGPTAGGTLITLTGAGFHAGATVQLGSAFCAGVTVVSATTITCLTPFASMEGVVNVTVVNADLQQALLTSGYTYYAAPAVNTVSPNTGPSTGGTAITVTGTDFRTGATVMVGTTPCLSVTVNSLVNITCTTGPTTNQGPQNVVVTNLDAQTGTLSAGFNYIREADHLVYISGDNQIQNPDTELAIALKAQVVDGLGNPVSGISLYFQKKYGDLAVPLPVQVSDSNGYVQTNAMLGFASGPGEVILARSGTPLPDLAFTGNATLNFQTTTFGQGNGVFPHPQLPTGSSPYNVATADFNGDGHQDVVVTNEGNATVEVFLGNGDGSFQAPVSYSTGNEPTSVAVQDVNGDGFVDIVAANRSDNTVSVLLGNGDGTFQSQVTYASGYFPYFVVLGDFRGNGKVDIVVANVFSGTISVLLGNGDGTFQPRVTYATGAETLSIVVADFNRDGKLDLAVANGADGTVGVLLGNGDGTFQPQVAYTAGSTPYSVAAGDFNKDGKTDIVVTNFDGNTVGIFLGVGDGTFEPQVTYATGNSPIAVVASDLNNDGNPDLVVADSGGNAVSVLMGNGDGTFQTHADVTTGATPNSIAAADFDSDGKQDLVIATSGTDLAAVLLGNGDGTFQTQTTYTTGASPESISGGDFNGDGKSDLVVANYSGNSVGIFLGNGDGTFQTQITYPTGAGPDGIAVADLNGDGKPDLAVSNYSSNTVSILLGNGDGTFQTQVAYSVGNHPRAITIADVNGDGKLDLIVANYSSNNISVLWGNGDGTFQTQTTYSTGAEPYSIAAGDFNGDGIVDVVVANLNSSTISVLIGKANGTFQSQVTYPAQSQPCGVVVGDFNGDGQVDLAVVNKLSSALSIYLGNGDGTFQSQVTYASGNLPTSISVADLNADGRQDLVITNSNDSVASVLFGNGDGTFGSALPYASGGTTPSASFLGDFTGAHKTDIAVVNAGSNSIAILLGK